MAYLTQFSNSVPLIKFVIDQNVMSIGQNFEMDICIPEDGIAESHASLESIKKSDSYQFIVTSCENESLLELNGNTVAQAELQDGDWLTIGGVEFQFTDDGIDLIKATNAKTPVSVEIKEAQVSETTKSPSPALELLKDLQEEIKSGDQTEPRKLTTKEFIANSRQSRRRLAI